MYFRAGTFLTIESYLYLYLKEGEYLWLCFLSSRYKGCIFCILSKILFKCIFPNPAIVYFHF